MFISFFFSLAEFLFTSLSSEAERAQSPTRAREALPMDRCLILRDPRAHRQLRELLR